MKTIQLNSTGLTAEDRQHAEDYFRQWLECPRIEWLAVDSHSIVISYPANSLENIGSEGGGIINLTPIAAKGWEADLNAMFANRAGRPSTTPQPKQ